MNLEEMLATHYPIRICYVPEGERRGHYLAFLTDFGPEECSAKGATPAEALERLQEEKIEVFRRYIGSGRLIPEPSSSSADSFGAVVEKEAYGWATDYQVHPWPKSEGAGAYTTARGPFTSREEATTEALKWAETISPDEPSFRLFVGRVYRPRLEDVQLGWLTYIAENVCHHIRRELESAARKLAEQEAVRYPSEHRHSGWLRGMCMCSGFTKVSPHTEIAYVDCFPEFSWGKASLWALSETDAKEDLLRHIREWVGANLRQREDFWILTDLEEIKREEREHG